MNIRTVRQQDHSPLRSVVAGAFGQVDEASLVESLRVGGDAVIELVAVEGGAIVGHAMFSAMSAPFRALGLAPVAVDAGHQRRGIGSMIIREGLGRAKDAAWEAVFVLGDPAYYERFGFRAEPASGFVSPHGNPQLMVLPLNGSLPVSTGRIDYAPAFGALR